MRLALAAVLAGCSAENATNNATALLDAATKLRAEAAALEIQAQAAAAPASIRAVIATPPHQHRSMAKAPKKQKQTKRTKKRRIVEVIPGASDADARAALREELEAHAARYRDPSEFAAETEQTLLALESRADAEAKARQAQREAGADADGWQVVTYKRKAVSAEPREPASRAKKAKKQQQFVDGADFYKFQVKQKRLGEMRAELDAKKDRRRAPRRKFNS